MTEPVICKKKCQLPMASPLLSKRNWTVYMEETESRYLEDTAAVESGRCCLEDGLQDWYGLNAI